MEIKKALEEAKAEERLSENAYKPPYYCMMQNRQIDGIQ
tara:strand:- start:80 stop:196 length:117 start_codon:yes stop_codon:yes gene_type:complete